MSARGLVLALDVVGGLDADGGSRMLGTTYGGGFAISPNDNIDLPQKPQGIFVGGTGIIVATLGGVDCTFIALVAGSILPISPSRVKSATTATGLIGLIS